MTKLEKAMAEKQGWRNLIQETNAKLKALNDPKIEFFPYQKYASLRYNTGIYSSDEIDKIIDEAETKSEYLCIACGFAKKDINSSLCKNCLSEWRKDENRE